MNEYASISVPPSRPPIACPRALRRITLQLGLALVGWVTVSAAATDDTDRIGRGEVHHSLLRQATDQHRLDAVLRHRFPH